MVPHDTRKGDEVCLLLRCRVPVVLRQRIEGGYELVGEVYLHGVMKGEAMTEENMEKLGYICIRGRGDLSLHGFSIGPSIQDPKRYKRHSPHQKSEWKS